MPTKNPLGTFQFLNVAQFTGALNDNIFKLVAIYAIVLAWPEVGTKQTMGVVGVAFALPFLLFLGWAGSLADRIAKDKILRVTKFVEVLIMAFAILAIFTSNAWLLLITVFAMSTQSAFFGPVKYGLIPDIVEQVAITRANAYLQAATYMAIIAGTLMAPALSGLFGGNYALVVAACLVFAIVGWLASFGVARVPPVRRDAASVAADRKGRFTPRIFKSMRLIHEDGFLALSVWGDAYFATFAAFAQLNLIAYGSEHLGLDTPEKGTLLFLVMAVGVGVGSLVAGRLSRRGIEIGLIPPAVLILGISGLALGLLPQGALIAAVTACFFLGFGGGLFLVPIEAFIQFRAAPERRGAIIAASSWLSWAGVLVAAVMTFVLAEGFGWSAAQGILAGSILLLVLFVASVVVLPDFLLRFFVMMITRCFYRVQHRGLEHLPASGPALLVCNHVSLMDALWLLSLVPRRLRFLMSREYLAGCSGFARALFSLGGVIPISTNDPPKAVMKALKEARSAMERGYIVAIFPEGELSRTGHMQTFRAGFTHIVKGRDWPIIPMAINGGFGSRASHAFIHPHVFAAEDFWRKITVVAGPPMATGSDVRAVQAAVRGLAASAASIAAERHIGRLFVHTAKKSGSRRAISDSSGRVMDYQITLVAALGLRRVMRRQVPMLENEVGVILPPSVPAALVNIALTISSKVSVNLNYSASAEAVRAAIDAVPLQTIISSKAVLSKLPDLPLTPRVLYVEDLFARMSVIDKALSWLESRLVPAAFLVNPVSWSPDSPVTILFSSGSTALPKGVALSHRNIIANVDSFSSVARPRVDDCVCGVLPFFHSMGFTTTLWFPLTRGIAAAYHHHPLETDGIDKIGEMNRITILIGTPTFMLAWARKVKAETFANARWVCAGAEKLRPKVAELFEKKFGVRPMEGYGSTECSPVIAVNVPDVEVDGMFQAGFREGSVGRLLPNLCARVVDPDSGTDIAVDTPGVLLIKGPSVMLGYWKAPELTAKVLVDGWYHTGDVVRIDADDFIFIKDRLSRFSKIAGEMVSHTAVETALHDALGCKPDQLAIVGRADEKRGEQLVVIFDQSLGSAEGLWKQCLASSIPNLWRPAQSDWIALEKIPFLPTGKLDLGALKKLAAQP
jgi:acyl-[acyl-carrier-protein]-phospholipid O-acyltransferase/long-chain-fatty-acid--[acyl-carrier-protein] ligase